MLWRPLTATDSRTRTSSVPVLDTCARVCVCNTVSSRSATCLARHSEEIYAKTKKRASLTEKRCTAWARRPACACVVCFCNCTLAHTPPPQPHTQRHCDVLPSKPPTRRVCCPSGRCADWQWQGPPQRKMGRCVRTPQRARARSRAQVWRLETNNTSIQARNGQIKSTC